ncbi:MAG: BTAD domain-containing putative transcriptional regulator, partial [Longimicrobiales bacterium]
LDEQRRALNARIVSAAWKLAAVKAESGDLTQAITAARAATRLACEDEAGLRRLMALLDRAGNRAAALAEFERFERWLHEQLEVDPAPETIEMARRIRDRTHANGHDSGTELPQGVVETSALTSATAPTTIARRSRLRVALTAIVVIAATTGMWLNQSSATTTPERTPIAIIPFATEIADSTFAYFGSALSESVADELFSPLAVSYTATQALANQDRALTRRRARDLGARTLISGTVSGRRDSLQLQIVIEDVDRSRVFRRATLRGSERELLLLRDGVIAEVRKLVDVPVRRARAGYVPTPEAYQLALNAFWLLGTRSPDELFKARDLYNEALEHDPQWQEPWLGLARVYGVLAGANVIDYRNGFRASEHAANEALLRAPDDPRALIERGMARFHLGDRAGAEADARRAATLDSTDFHMQSLIGTWWKWSGGPIDSALVYKRRAQRLAPWDRAVATQLVELVECTFDSKATLAEARRALDVYPDAPNALETYAWALADLGRWDEATSAYERRYAEQVAAGVTSEAHRLMGEARFRAVVRALRSGQHRQQLLHPPRSQFGRIGLFEDLGKRDSSLAVLASVVDSVHAHRAYSMCAPNFRSLRADPRVLAIYKQRGWPLSEFAR